VPAQARNEIRLEVDTRGNAITIVECRPQWDDPAAEWTRSKVAQLRHDPADNTWTLHWSDRNGRWHAYDDLAPSVDLDVFLSAIDDDPASIFWG
jgi:hypothetical protein